MGSFKTKIQTLVLAVLIAACAVLALGYHWGIGKILLLAAVAGVGIQFLLPLS